eukprot:scaffold345332_cov46-Prasinocladus_malaysianus.AAC.1
MDMMRACRLVVDTGLHAFGWPRERAVAYMANHCAQPLHELENEVTRYIAWPGQVPRMLCSSANGRSYIDFSAYIPTQCDFTEPSDEHISRVLGHHGSNRQALMVAVPLPYLANYTVSIAIARQSLQWQDRWSRRTSISQSIEFIKAASAPSLNPP